MSMRAHGAAGLNVRVDHRTQSLDAFEQRIEFQAKFAKFRIHQLRDFEGAFAYNTIYCQVSK